MRSSWNDIITSRFLKTNIVIKPEVIPRIEQVIKEDYKLRFNIVTNRLEICTTKDNNFKPVSEVQYNVSVQSTTSCTSPKNGITFASKIKYEA